MDRDADYIAVRIAAKRPQSKSVEVKGVKNNPVSGETKEKWCVCHVATKTGLIWKATGRKNSDNLSEYQCKICGATAWR